MQYAVHRPRPPLSELVDYLWCLSDAPVHSRERIVPSGTIELVVNLAEDEFRIYDSGTEGESCRRFRGAIVSGCYSTFFGIDTREHASVIGVHFKPGGAARLLGIPPGEIVDAHVDLDALWGRRATELRDRLCTAPTRRRRFELLEQGLMARLPLRPRARSAVNAALTELERRGVEVGQVAHGLGLSRRRLIEIFTRDVGMTPKRYSRVCRFQRALALALGSQPPAWAQIALEAGYFDQAHLCRDWVEFTGVSPARFVALCGTRVKDNHLALPAGGVKSVQYVSPPGG